MNETERRFLVAFAVALAGIGAAMGRELSGLALVLAGACLAGLAVPAASCDHEPVEWEPIADQQAAPSVPIATLFPPPPEPEAPASPQILMPQYWSVRLGGLVIPWDDLAADAQAEALDLLQTGPPILDLDAMRTIDSMKFPRLPRGTAC